MVCNQTYIIQLLYNLRSGVIIQGMDKTKTGLKVSPSFAVYKYLKLGHPPDEKNTYIQRVSGHQASTLHSIHF